MKALLIEDVKMLWESYQKIWNSWKFLKDLDESCKNDICKCDDRSGSLCNKHLIQSSLHYTREVLFDTFKPKFEEWRKLVEQGDQNIIEENNKLKEAIRCHRDKTGHSLCWLNDRELWSVLGEAEYPHNTLPVKDEFINQCAKYYDSRLVGTEYEEPKVKDVIPPKPTPPENMIVGESEQKNLPKK